MNRVRTLQVDAATLVLTARDLSEADLAFAMTVKAIAISDLPEHEKVATFCALMADHGLVVPATRH